MADILGTTLSVGNGLSQTGQSNTDLLLAAFRKTKQADLDTIKSKTNSLESRQVFFNQLNTKLQTLQGSVNDLLQTSSNSKFTSFKSASSDSTILSVTNTSDASPSNISVKVDRLATNDTLIAQQNTLTSAYAYAGQTKTIEINGASVDVTFAADDTNESAFKRIATALNNTPDAKVSVALVKDTTLTGRLTFSAKNTGNSNQITFSDGDVLIDMGITDAALNQNTHARTVSSGINAGYKTTDYDTLNAKLTVNGVEVVRDSNSPSDILPGITFSFLKAQNITDQPITVTVGSDADGVADKVITPLLSAYNDVLKFLNDNVSQVRGDSALRSLQSSLRGLFGQEITSVDSGNPRFLADAGITIASNGLLSVTKKDTLNSLLQSDPKKVADLFISTDGFAAKIMNAVSGLTGSDGTIASRTELLRTQITTLNKRSKDVQQRIDTQADSLRKEYQKLQKLYLDAQNQTALLHGFV